MAGPSYNETVRMTYDGGWQESKEVKDPVTGKTICRGTDTDRISGIYFTYATDPWGPWAPAQLIYNAATGGGFGTYIHNVDVDWGPTGGPQGPIIGSGGDECKDRGATYGPFMVSRFNQIDSAGKMLSIYYTMSTLNPYTILLMRADFTIGRGRDE